MVSAFVVTIPHLSIISQVHNRSAAKLALSCGSLDTLGKALVTIPTSSFASSSAAAAAAVAANESKTGGATASAVGGTVTAAVAEAERASSEALLRLAALPLLQAKETALSLHVARCARGALSRLHPSVLAYSVTTTHRAEAAERARALNAMLRRYYAADPTVAAALGTMVRRFVKGGSGGGGTASTGGGGTATDGIDASASFAFPPLLSPNASFAPSSSRRRRGESFVSVSSDSFVAPTATADRSDRRGGGGSSSSSRRSGGSGNSGVTAAVAIGIGSGASAPDLFGPLLHFFSLDDLQQQLVTFDPTAILRRYNVPLLGLGAGVGDTSSSAASASAALDAIVVANFTAARKEAEAIIGASSPASASAANALSSTSRSASPPAAGAAAKKAVSPARRGSAAADSGAADGSSSVPAEALARVFNTTPLLPPTAVAALASGRAPLSAPLVASASLPPTAVGLFLSKFAALQEEVVLLREQLRRQQSAMAEAASVASASPAVTAAVAAQQQLVASVVKSTAAAVAAAAVATAPTTTVAAKGPAAAPAGKAPAAVSPKASPTKAAAGKASPAASPAAAGAKGKASPTKGSPKAAAKAATAPTAATPPPPPPSSEGPQKAAAAATAAAVAKLADFNFAALKPPPTPAEVSFGARTAELYAQNCALGAQCAAQQLQLLTLQRDNERLSTMVTALTAERGRSETAMEALIAKLEVTRRELEEARFIGKNTRSFPYDLARLSAGSDGGGIGADSGRRGKSSKGEGRPARGRRGSFDGDDDEGVALTASQRKQRRSDERRRAAILEALTNLTISSSSNSATTSSTYSGRRPRPNTHAHLLSSATNGDAASGAFTEEVTLREALLRELGTLESRLNSFSNNGGQPSQQQSQLLLATATGDGGESAPPTLTAPVGVGQQNQTLGASATASSSLVGDPSNPVTWDEIERLAAVLATGGIPTIPSLASAPSQIGAVAARAGARLTFFKAIADSARAHLGPDVYFSTPAAFSASTATATANAAATGDAAAPAPATEPTPPPTEVDAVGAAIGNEETTTAAANNPNETPEEEAARRRKERKERKDRERRETEIVATAAAAAAGMPVAPPIQPLAAAGAAQQQAPLARRPVPTAAVPALSASLSSSPLLANSPSLPQRRLAASEVVALLSLRPTLTAYQSAVFSYVVQRVETLGRRLEAELLRNTRQLTTAVGAGGGSVVGSGGGGGVGGSADFAVSIDRDAAAEAMLFRERLTQAAALRRGGLRALRRAQLAAPSGEYASAPLHVEYARRRLLDGHGGAVAALLRAQAAAAPSPTAFGHLFGGGIEVEGGDGSSNSGSLQQQQQQHQKHRIGYWRGEVVGAAETHAMYRRRQEEHEEEASQLKKQIGNHKNSHVDPLSPSSPTAANASAVLTTEQRAALIIRERESQWRESGGGSGRGRRGADDRGVGSGDNSGSDSEAGSDQTDISHFSVGSERPDDIHGGGLDAAPNDATDPFNYCLWHTLTWDANDPYGSFFKLLSALRRQSADRHALVEERIGGGGSGGGSSAFRARQRHGFGERARWGDESAGDDETAATTTTSSAHYDPSVKLSVVSAFLSEYHRRFAEEILFGAGRMGDGMLAPFSSGGPRVLAFCDVDAMRRVAAAAVPTSLLSSPATPPLRGGDNDGPGVPMQPVASALESLRRDALQRLMERSAAAEAAEAEKKKAATSASLPQ